MASTIRTAADFISGVSRAFTTRWRHKGFRSACIYLRVTAYDFMVAQRNKGTGEPRVECPCCGWKGQDFLAMDSVKFWLPGVFCPQCRSHERQRMLELYIRRHHPELFDMEGIGVHFAPEPDVRNLLLQCKSLKYITADLEMAAVRRYPD